MKTEQIKFHSYHRFVRLGVLSICAFCMFYILSESANQSFQPFVCFDVVSAILQDQFYCSHAAMCYIYIYALVSSCINLLCSILQSNKCKHDHKAISEDHVC